MNNFTKIFFIAISSLSLWACSTAVKEKNANIEVDELYFAQEPEPINGKIDVYNSMARAVKYNVDITTQNLNKKIFTDNPNMQPQDVVRKMLNVKSEKENPLYGGLKVLDFAIIHAITRLSDKRSYVDGNLYAKSSQSLALAAIKSHKDALFAQKKIKVITRLIDQEQKILTGLNKKLDRVGSLSKDDQAYQKGLEVAIMKLSELRAALVFNINEYAQLVKADEKKMSFEGRKFYELEDLDESLTVSAFQNSAYRNRNEFAMPKEFGKSYTYVEIDNNLLKRYPEVERLRINGYNAEDPIYAEELEKRASNVAVSLLNAVASYQVATKVEEKKFLREKAFDELTIAIFTQVELAFDLVQAVNFDLEVVSKQIVEIKKEIKTLEKLHRPNVEQNLDLLNKKIKLFELERKESQVLAEKALAIRSLYFYAGFSPFNKKLLKANVSDIVGMLKVGFNKDVVEMLAAVPEQQKTEDRMENRWAKQDNWLEKLLEAKNAKPEANSMIVIPVKTFGDFDMYEGEEFDKKKVMQLGSYRQVENVDIEWKMLKELYPEFSEYNPIIEKTKVNKKIMYRLVIRSSEGGFKDICNKLRQDRVECILR